MSRITIMGRNPPGSLDDRSEHERRPGTSQEFYRLRRRLGVAAVALISVIAVGSIFYSIIGAGEHGLIDAFYMTVITLTTVGFSEIIDMSNNPAGRVALSALPET